MWAQWLADVEQELERNPTRNVFSVSPNDSAYSGYCICDNCRAWDHPDLEMVRYTWQGLTQEYVAQSSRLITLTNMLSRMLKERFPERDDIFIAVSTYGNAHPVPIGVVPDDNVIVSVFANIHNRPFAEEGRGTRKNLADWSRSGAKNIRARANWQQILRILEQYPHAFSGYIRPREDGKGKHGTGQPGSSRQNLAVIKTQSNGGRAA